MALTKASTSLLMDLVENKLAMLQIDGREDLREVLILQRCLEELKHAAQDNANNGKADNIPRRGRHKNLESMMAEMEVPARLYKHA